MLLVKEKIQFNQRHILVLCNFIKKFFYCCIYNITLIRIQLNNSIKKIQFFNLTIQYKKKKKYNSLL